MITTNIDLRFSNNIGGISNFIRNVASNLSPNENIDYCGSSFWYRGRDKNQYTWFKGKVHYSVLPERIVCNSKCVLPLSYEAAANVAPDINLFFTYRLPKLHFRKPVISTIHDIILLRSKCESNSVISEHEQILRRTIENSHHLLTVSLASKGDLVDYFGINPDMISIVHNGIDYDDLSNPISESEREYVRKKYSLPNKFILNFGAYRVHKNIERLIKAYSLLPMNLRKEYKLVLTRSSQTLDRLISEFNLTNDVIITGFVDEVDKKALYQLADLVYYASLYEGFGVPIIEAQACHTPVLTSITSSMPEAAGDAALLVDPYSVDDIRDGILLMINDSGLRENLIRKGDINAMKYSWNKSAKEVELVLNNLSL